MCQFIFFIIGFLLGILGCISVFCLLELDIFHRDDDSLKK